jgi:acyl-CoA reductase-like NAD-dependent aldehyde dehydrogenase
MPVVEITLAEGRSPEKIRALITFDKFVDAMKAKAAGMTPGRPDDPATKIGP